MTDKLTKCSACDGRGYHRCACWPGDCICGQDDEPCWECSGDGWLDESYDHFDPTPSPQPNVTGRWRVIEAATAPGYWGIEREDAGNDDDAILYPQKIHRDTVARIVEAHNAALAATEGKDNG